MKQNIIIGAVTVAMMVFVYLGAYGFINTLDENIYARPEYFLPVSILVVAALFSFIHRSDDDK